MIPGRWLYAWHGTVMRLRHRTTDGRMIVAPAVLRTSLTVPSRPLPVQLTCEAEVIGMVTAFHLGHDGSSIVASGLLDMFMLGHSIQRHLLRGGAMEAGADLDQCVTHNGDPDSPVTHIFTDWRIRSVATSPEYRSAWALPTQIRLQTGHYADSRRWGRSKLDDNQQ